MMVNADLRFEVSFPDRPALHGRLIGQGDQLELQVDDPGAFAGRRDAPAIRGLADLLARYGLAIRVTSDDVHLVTIGATRAPWWQRRATQSRHIRLAGMRGAWTSARARTRATEPVLPDGGLAPPATLFPLAPTFQRWSRRPATTTHDPAHGGGARLLLVPREDSWPGDRQLIYWLGDDVTTIGSSVGSDIRLAGLAGLHAEVHHDEDDEFVLVSHDVDTRVHGGRVRQQTLRTGSRVEVGRWQLVYYREEYADHGRPHGGRIGGELGRQLSQPPRGRRDVPDLPGSPG